MENDLKKRAKKHSKKQKGMSPFSSFNDNAGDEIINTQSFNNAMGASCGGGGACEGLDTLEAWERLDNLDESIAINEASLSRILQHTEGTDGFAVIGSRDKDTGEDRYNELVAEVSEVIKKNVGKIPIGYNRLKGTYTYHNGTTTDEDSLIIYNIPKKDALQIAKDINQESIIWHDDDFFGFLTPQGEKDGDLGRGLSFDKDKVRMFGSRINSKHNKGKPWVFEAFLVETTNRGNNTSKHHKADIKKYDLFTIKF